MQHDLFGREGVGDVRDARDRHFTPDPLADVIIERLAKHIDPPAVVVEPSVGGGAFARAVRKRWPGAHIVGVDIDPDAEGFAFVDESVVGDWLEVARSSMSGGVTSSESGPPSCDTTLRSTSAAARPRAAATSRWRASPLSDEPQ